MDTTSEQPFLEELRRKRGELRGSMSALEHALASAATGDSAHWAQRVHVALVELSADLREHVTITEGPEGLYREVIRAEPRLSDPVARLTQEHGVFAGQVEDLIARVNPPGPLDVEVLREQGSDLIRGLMRHRQKGADLVYEAYEFDIGGDT